MKIAPLRLRLLAGFINVLPPLTGLAGGFFTAGKCAHMDMERWKPLTEKLRSFSGRAPHLNVAWSVASETLALQSRNSRGPVSRLVGIRRVDARTGGPVTARQALTRLVLVRLSMDVGKVQSEDVQRRTRAIEPEIAKIREAHPHDKQAQQRELMALYEKYGINQARSCGWRIAPAVLMALPALIPPRHQTLPDLLAGTVVVVDR